MHQDISSAEPTHLQLRTDSTLLEPADRQWRGWPHHWRHHGGGAAHVLGRARHAHRPLGQQVGRSATTHIHSSRRHQVAVGASQLVAALGWNAPEDESAVPNGGKCTQLPEPSLTCWPPPQVRRPDPHHRQHGLQQHAGGGARDQPGFCRRDACGAADQPLLRQDQPSGSAHPFRGEFRFRTPAASCRPLVPHITLDSVQTLIA